MGVCKLGVCGELYEEKLVVGKGDFVFIDVIGNGGSDNVWRVLCLRNREQLAIKEFSKGKVLAKHSVQLVLNEVKILGMLQHPFIVNLHYAFSDNLKLLLVTDLLEGGDLRYHLKRKKAFSESEVKFLASCLVSAIEYLQCNEVIHRDLKPENLVFDRAGYLHMSGFGAASAQSHSNGFNYPGTPGYMAPEVLCRMSCSLTSDYFSLGVILYELIVGERPYTGKTRREIREQIISSGAGLSRKHLEGHWSCEIGDFVNRLLVRKATSRLGARGVGELKAHPWLQDVQWEQLYRKQLRPPYCPGQVSVPRAPCIHSGHRPIQYTASYEALFSRYYYDKDAQK